MRVFQRRYELYVVQPFKFEEIKTATQNMATNKDVIVDDNIDRLIGYNTYSESRTTYDDSLLITDPIQLEADIKYNRNGTEGGAEIRLYNLSNQTLSRIQGNMTVLLKAGYRTDSELPILYVGTIQKVFSKREGAHRVTTLFCKEAGIQQKDLQYNHCYIRGTTYSEIIADIADYLNVNGIPTSLTLSSQGIKRSTRYQLIANAATSGFKQSAPRSSVFDEIIDTVTTGSFNVSGNVFSSLTSICESIAYVWFVSKGVVYVQPRENQVFQDYVVISPDVVIGNISPFDNQSGVSSQDTAATLGQGIDVVVFLDARLALENLVKVEYGDFVGTYVITDIQHKLNWYSGPWQTEVRTKPLEQLTLNRVTSSL